LSPVEIVKRPFEGVFGTALYIKLMLSTFLPSILTGDLTVLVKEGLSILIVNSHASKKGFLKSIGGGLAEILNGPLGCGSDAYPLRMQTYSPESGDATINWHTLSDIEEGSNLTFTNASVP